MAMNTKASDDPFAGIVLPPLTRQPPFVESVDQPYIEVQRSPFDSVSGGSSEPEITENGAINLVGADGTLNAATKHSTWVPGTTYPTTLKTSDFPTSITLNTSGLEIDNGSERVRIFFNAFNKNMAIKEIDVCVDGVNKKMLILASDPYIP